MIDLLERSTICEQCCGVIEPEARVVCWECFTDRHGLIERLERLGDRIRDGQGERITWWLTMRELAADLRLRGK